MPTTTDTAAATVVGVVTLACVLCRTPVRLVAQRPRSFLLAGVLLVFTVLRGAGLVVRGCLAVLGHRRADAVVVIRGETVHIRRHRVAVLI